MISSRRPTTPSSQPNHPPDHRRPAQPAPQAPTVLAPGPLQRDHAFGPIPVSEPVARALAAMGYTSPTPIQEQAIPVLRAGKDIVGKAQTGTGKTTAFGLPMVEMLDPAARHTQALVLTPTRELAMQVAEEVRKLARFRGLRVVTLYGGQPIARQFADLRPGAHIIVGTPGRVLDHLGRGTVRLDGVRFAVLDEADQMLDIGFAEDMVRILGLTPSSRQTALFSATMPPAIRRLVHRFLRQPHWIEIGGERSEPPSTIRQVYYEVAQEDKLRGLTELLQTRIQHGKVLIFRRTQRRVDQLAALLQRHGYQGQGIHGGLRQSQRDAVMGAFRAGTLRILVATNVAARGLDIPAVSHVINYDMPETVDEYVHRIGRTGRLGRDGTAVTFVSEADFDVLDDLLAHLGDDLRKERLALYS